MKEPNFWKNIGIEKYELLKESDSLSVFQSWKAIYCPSLNFKLEGGYAWEKIGGIAALDKALEVYNQNSSIYYYVLSEPKKSHIEVALTKEKPRYVDKFRYDFYVFPKNFAWCMCFTHEDGWLGPIFAKHPLYEKLQKKNVEAIDAMGRG